VLWVQGRYQDAGPVAEDLLRLARNTGREDQAASAKLARAYFHAVAGDLSRTLALSREAVDHARAARHPFREMDSLMLLGYSLQSAGLYGEALDALQQARELAARIHSRHHLASVESCRGQIFSEQERAAEARQYFSEARRCAAQTATRPRPPSSWSGLDGCWSSAPPASPTTACATASCPRCPTTAV
jgi:tetratricopeptide (TPR) repeat protein